MPDIFDLFIRWWKQILLLVVIAVITTAIIVFTMPKQYLAVATAIPAPTYTADKGGVFSQNLQVLYPSVGTSDDLDMILGTAHLDTVYTAVADELNLADYYGVSKTDPEAVKKAASILKGRTRVIKSDYGELKVKVWDADRNRVAEMSNAVMQKLQEMHQGVQIAGNATMLSKIKEEYAGKKVEFQKLNDSLTRNFDINSVRELLAAQRASLLQQIQEYEKLINQYQLMVNAKPPALVIVEKASPPLWPDRPRPKQTLIAAALLSFFFALLAALLLERRRTMKN